MAALSFGAVAEAVSPSVIVRGIGPHSADFGVADALADPLLELHNSDGDLIDSNDNWMDNPNMQTITDKGLAPSDPNEAALYEILPAGLYTAILSGVGETTGTGLVETYDVDPPMIVTSLNSVSREILSSTRLGTCRHRAF